MHCSIRRTLTLCLLLAAAAGSEAQRIYWTDGTGGTIRRADLSGAMVETIVVTGATSAIALDVAGGKMYWGNYAGAMQRANLDGTAIETLLYPVRWVIHSIALHVDSGKLYWTEGGGDTIGRANLDGSGIETFYSVNSFPIVVDRYRGLLYWIEGSGSVLRARLDLSNVQFVVTPGLTSRDMAIDFCDRKIYWSEGGFDYTRVNFDGSGREVISVAPRTASALALDPVSGKIYLGDPTGTGSIHRANLDGSLPELLVTGAGEVFGLALELPWGQCAGTCGDCDGSGGGP